MMESKPFAQCGGENNKAGEKKIEFCLYLGIGHRIKLSPAQYRLQLQGFVTNLILFFSGSDMNETFTM
jgi:hypothetical protein